MRAKTLRQLWKEEAGLTAVEFAFVAPVLCLIIFGTIEFSMIMYATSTMESATSNASRLGKTGYIAEGKTRFDQIREMVEARSRGLLKPDDIEIETKYYSDFDDLGEPEPFNDKNKNGFWDEGEPFDDINRNNVWDEDMGLAGQGNAGDIVIYNVTYPWEVMTPFLAQLIGTEGVVTIRSQVIVKNEPYDVTQQMGN